jgi:hypothetical protein
MASVAGISGEGRREAAQGGAYFEIDKGVRIIRSPRDSKAVGFVGLACRA